MERKLNDSGVSVQKILYLAIYIIFIIFFAVWCTDHWNILPGDGYEQSIFPWIAASLLLNLIGFLFVKKVAYIDIGFIFVICSYLFMFGHVFLEVLGFSTSLTWNPAQYFSELEKFQAAVYSYLCLSAMTIGYIMCGKTSYSKTERSVTEETKNDDKMTFRAGLVFFCIGLAANIISSGRVIQATLAANSYSNYTAAEMSGILDDFAYLVVPGIVYMFSSRVLSKRKAIGLLVASILYFVVTMVLSGSRKVQIFAILTIIISYLWTRERRKITLKKMLGLAVVTILFLNLIYIIREHRTNLSTILPSYFESLGNFEFLGSIVGETFAESGLSFYSIVAIFSTVPSIFPFEYGMTFIRTIPSILPIGSFVGDFFYKASSSYVINRYTGIPVGTSLLGDFYWNFGFIGGIIACLLMGALLSRFTRKMFENGKEALYFSVSYILMIGIRAGIMEMFRPLVMVTIVPLIIKFFLFKRSNKIQKCA